MILDLVTDEGLDLAQVCAGFPWTISTRSSAFLPKTNCKGTIECVARELRALSTYPAGDATALFARVHSANEGAGEHIRETSHALLAALHSQRSVATPR